MTADEWLTSNDVAKMLDVSTKTVERWASLDTPLKDRLRSVRKGKRYTRFRPADVASWRERHKR